MTTDTAALQERVAEELYYEQHPEGRHRGEWPAAVYPDTVHEYRDLAAAVLPIIRAAQADAWDEGYGDCWTYHQSEGLRGREDNPYRATEYETGGQP